MIFTNKITFCLFFIINKILTNLNKNRHEMEQEVNKDKVINIRKILVLF